MLAAFTDLILPTTQIKFSTDNKGILILKETAKDSVIKKLKIKGMPKNSFAFTLDYQPKKTKCFKQLTCYVDPANNKGINKGCDLVVVTQRNNQWLILLLELKSNKPNFNETKKQLRNSELFIRYLVSMLEEYYPMDAGTINYQYTIVMTGSRNIRKNPTFQPNNSKLKDKDVHVLSLSVFNGNASTYFNSVLPN